MPINETLEIFILLFQQELEKNYQKNRYCLATDSEKVI